MGKIRTSNKRRFNRKRSKKIMRGGTEEPKPTPIRKGRGAFKINPQDKLQDAKIFETRFTDILKKMDEEFIIPAALSYNLKPSKVALCDYMVDKTDSDSMGNEESTEKKDYGGKEDPKEEKNYGVPKNYNDSAKTNLEKIGITTEKLAAWNKCLEPLPPKTTEEGNPEKLLILADAHGGIIPGNFTIPDNIVLCLLTRLGQYGYTNGEDRGHEFLSLSDRNPEYYETLFRDKIKRTTDMGMDEFYTYDNGSNFIKNDCFAYSSWYYPGQECDNMDISMSFEGENFFRPFGIYFINPQGKAEAKDRKKFDLGDQPIDKYAEGTKLYYDKNYFSKKNTTLEYITTHFNTKFGAQSVSSAKASVLLVVHCCRRLGKEKETTEPFFNDFYTQVINNYLIDNNVRETDLEKKEVSDEAGAKTTKLTLTLPTHHLPISNVIKKYTLTEQDKVVALNEWIKDRIKKYEEIKNQIVVASAVSFSPHELLKRIEKVIDDLVSNFITILPLEEFKKRFNKLVKHPLSRAIGVPEAYGKDENINLNIEAFQTEFNRLTPLSEEIDKKIINSDIDKIATIKELINSLNIEEFVTPGDIQPTIKAISDFKKATTFVEIHKQISIIKEKIIYGGFRDKLRQNIIASAEALDNGSEGYVLIKNSRDVEKIKKEGPEGKKEAKWNVQRGDPIKITKAFDSFGHPIGYGEEGADDYYSDKLKYYPDDVPEYDKLFTDEYPLNADNLINSIRELDDSNFPVRLILETGTKIIEQENNMKTRLKQKIDNYISLLKQKEADEQLGNIKELEDIYEIITNNYEALRELEDRDGEPEDEDIKTEIEYLNPKTLYFKRDYGKENDFIFALNNLSNLIETRILNYVDNVEYSQLKEAGEITRLDDINMKYMKDAHFKKKDSEDLINPLFLCVSNSTFVYLAKTQGELGSKYSDIYESYNPLCNVFTLKIYDFIKKVENLELEYDNIEKIVLNKLKTSSIGKFSILCYYFYNKSNEFDRIFSVILKYKNFDKTFQDFHDKLSKAFDDVFFAKNLKIPNEQIKERPKFKSLITTCNKILGIIKVAVEKIGTYQLGERTKKIIDKIKDEIEPPQPIPVIRIINVTEYLNDFELIVKNINYIKSCEGNPENLDSIYKTIIYSKVFNIIKRHAPHFLNSPGILKTYAKYYTKQQYTLNNPNSVLNHKLLQFVKMANLLNLDLKSYGFKIETPEIAVITNKQSLDFYATIVDDAQATSGDPASGGPASKVSHIIDVHINLEDSYEMEEKDFTNLEELIRNEKVYKLRIIGTTYPVLYANIFEKAKSFENIIKLDLDNTFGVDLNKINEIFPNLKKIVDNRCLSAETKDFDYTMFEKLNYLEINFSNKVSSTVNITSNAFSLKLFAADRTTNKITIKPESKITEIIIEYSNINKIEYTKDLTFLKIVNSSINEISGITRLEYAELYSGNNLVQLLDNIKDKVENLTINNYIDRFMPSLPLNSYTNLKKLKLNQSNIRLMAGRENFSVLPLIIEYHIPNEDVLKNLERFMKFDKIDESKLFLIGDRQVQIYYERRMQELKEKITSIREKIIYYPDWTRYNSSY